MSTPEKPSKSAQTTPLRALVEGAAWLLGLAAANHLVETVIAQNLLASTVATAVIADLGASRAGVSWADPSSADESRAAIGRRVLRAAGVALAAAFIVLLAGLALGLAQVDVAAPAWTTLLALLRAIALAVRAELLLRGVVFHFAARAGLGERWSLGFGALASGALLACAPFATPPAVALAIAGGALFGAVWSRLGGPRDVGVRALVRAARRGPRRPLERGHPRRGRARLGRTRVARRGRARHPGGPGAREVPPHRHATPPMSATTTLDDDPPAEAPPPPKRTRRWPFAVAALALVAVAIALFFPSILAYVAKEQALARGILLDFDELSLTAEGARFERATLRFVGVRGLTWTARGLDVHLAGFEPEALRATDVAVAAEGSLTDLTVDVTTWTGRFPRSLGVPFAAERVTARWSSAAGQEPWLALDGGSLAGRGQTTALRAASLTVSGVPLGGASAVWTGNDARAEIGVGSEELAKAPLRLVLGGEAGKRTAELSVARRSASELLAAFGLEVPPTKATLEGKVHFVLPAELETGVVAGTFVFDVHGFPLPHPKELAGIVHGDDTRIASRFEMSGDRRTVKLSELVVEAGALKAKGGGTLERPGDYALGSFELKGSIPCTLLSRSMGQNAGLGELGKLLGDLASQAVSGSVSFTVKGKADTRNVRAFQLTPSFGVGCGLRLP